MLDILLYLESLHRHNVFHDSVLNALAFTVLCQDQSVHYLVSHESEVVEVV